MRSIFYSWQNDTESKYNRYFLEECLKEAIKFVNRSIEEGENFELDSDTRNVAGSPDIAETILKKIDNSDIVVADVTIIGQISDNKKNS